MTSETIGRGRWNEAGVPHRGWICIDFADLGKPTEICEMCQHAKIRYVHVMQHPDYPEALRCGCVCAENMEHDYTAARRREQIAKNHARRRANWLERKWHYSSKGNPYLNVDGFNIVLFPAGRQKWKGRITDRRTKRTILSKRDYDSLATMKLAAFDAMTVLKSRRGSGYSSLLSSVRTETKRRTNQ
jgi:hypothetical protein